MNSKDLSAELDRIITELNRRYDELEMLYQKRSELEMYFAPQIARMAISERYNSTDTSPGTQRYGSKPYAKMPEATAVAHSAIAADLRYPEYIKAPIEIERSSKQIKTLEALIRAIELRLRLTRS